MTNETSNRQLAGKLTEREAIADQALDWFLKLQDQRDDAALQAAFETWCAQDPSHLQEYRELENLWSSSSFEQAAASLTVATSPLPSSSATRTRSWYKPGFKRASLALVFAASLLIAIPLAPELLIRLQADYRTAAGEHQTIELADGSTMLLNTSSAVKVNFTEGRRNITLLKGEAYFDVTHDTERPFSVTGEFGTATVTGTAFSVRERDGSDLIVLERGRLEVTSTRKPQQGMAELLPQNLVVARPGGLGPVQNADTEKLLSWRSGRLVFDDTPFAEVLSELSRYRSAPLVLMRESAENLRISGSYKVSNLENAITTLADVAGLEFVALPGDLIIMY